jgi:WD40 repeat protein
MYPTSRILRILLAAMTGLLVSACATHPPEIADRTVEPRPIASDAGPPTAPLPRIETGMHTAIINRIAVDSGGRFLVTGSNDKTARVWDAATGKLLQVLRPPQAEGNEGKVYAVALSPDGATVAIGGWTGVDWGQACSIYLFDRAGGRLIKRLTGLDSTIDHLAFSADGRYLAAALWGANGVRVFRSSDWQQVMADKDYGDNSDSADFDRAGRLVTTSCDGHVRLYDASFKLTAKKLAPGGKQPFAARFSPDGSLVAVGFNDSTAVNVLSGADLSYRFSPDTAEADKYNLSSIAWSIDGRFLYAAGRYRDAASWHPILVWSNGGRGPAQRWRAATGTVMDLKPLAGGRLAFGAADPAFGVFDAGGRKQPERRGEILDLRGNHQKLRLSSDGSMVEFGFLTLTAEGNWSQRRARFELFEGRLSLDAPELPGLQAPRTAGEPEANWNYTETPRVAGQALALKAYETSRSLAFAPDNRGFALGSEWYVRFYATAGAEPRWVKPVPAVAWVVNVSADGRYVVAALGDGTLRWYSVKDGREVLALFVHPDGVRWIAWTPQGFFDAAAGGTALIGYHLNQGAERAGEFVAAGQLAERFFRHDLIAGLFAPGGEQALSAAATRLGDVRQVLQAGLPPKLELLSPAQFDSAGEYVLKVRVRDQGGGLGKYIYRIDGVEVQGRPADIPGAGADTVGRQFSLAPGRRVVSLAVANRNGVESVPVEAVVNVAARTERPALFVLAVGVTNYRDHALAQGVRYAAADAETVAARFKAQGEGLFRTAVVRSLQDQAATRAGIEATLVELAGQARPDDVFVLYLAGHGASLDGEYHFLPWEVRYTNEQALRDQSLNQEALRGLLQKLPARKTLLLLDTCSSGAFAVASSRGLEEKAAIDRLGKLSGRAVLAASSSHQMALEGEAGHGVFTHAVLEGLKKADRNNNGLIEVGELADFVEELVPSITQRKWGYEQFPVRYVEGASFSVGRRP